MNEENNQPNPFLEHPKTTEYANRISDGEDADIVLEGLPENIRAAVRERLGLNNPEVSEGVVEKHPSDMDATELEDFLETTIPPQYKGMSAEALEVVWSEKDVPYFADDPSGEKRQAEMRKRALVFATLEHFLPEAERRNRLKRQVRSAEKKQIETVKENLGISVAETSSLVENGEKFSKPLFSRELDPEQTHVLESKNEAITVVFDNQQHRQDGCAIDPEKGIVALCDGSSSYGKSRVLSERLAQSLATEAGSGKSLQEIFSEGSITSILEAIKSSDEFKNAAPEQGAHINSRNKEAGKTTALLTRALEDGSIEWASLGDSPLLVFDEGPDGTYKFQIVNDVDRQIITSDNFTEKKILESFADPETQVVGFSGDGSIDTKHLRSDKVRYGKIEYKKGRVVMSASDFLTKAMYISPESLAAKRQFSEQEGNKNMAEAWRIERDLVLKSQHPFSSEKFNPSFLFDGSIGPEELKKVIEQWKDISTNSHRRSQDDMTAIAIKMDKIPLNSTKIGNSATDQANEMAFAA